ncbi:MAG: phospholipase D [Gammaproteobacteria bacterium BRH_c0]|nr:MAG: phospholipase D [Gammaproteobacteria bacterium BRH_c0]
MEAPVINRPPRTSRKRLTILLALIVTATGLWHVFKPLPEGISYRGSPQPLLAPELLIDRTWVDKVGNQQFDQQIFDEALRLIGQARKLVVVDMFLFNESGPPGVEMRPLARQLTEALVARQQAVDDITIVMITDPFNTLYGGTRSPWLEQLRAAGIVVVETRLSPLRDSNPLWSAPWRLCCQWLGNSADHGWLPNPVGTDKVPLRSYLALLNFKANHRKVLVVDEGDGLRGLVTSANPHDGSSRHSNIALSFGGPAALDLLRTEQAVLALSGVEIAMPTFAAQIAAQQSQHLGQILTEGKILDAALAMIDGAAKGSQLDLAMFYLSHRELVEAMIDAHQRGAELRILLDANKDAFGREKNGIPNRQVAMELHRAGIPLRWCNTHGEQCHTKLLVRRDPDRSWQLLLGSANFTRRNLNDLNLETNIRVWADNPTPLLAELMANFDLYWHSGPDRNPVLSLPYEAFQDESTLKYWQYRVMEGLGLSTF